MKLAMNAAPMLAALGLTTAAGAGITLDDLSVATLMLGDSVQGDTSVSSDDMNGDAIGSGSWSGGDDVYTLVWGGGDLTIDLLFTHEQGDLDLFLFDNTLAGGPGELAQSLTTDDNEMIGVAGLAAGTYYVSVDGWFGDTNTYTLSVPVPAPAALAAIGLAGLSSVRRRR